jgi:hypothetical protein
MAPSFSYGVTTRKVTDLASNPYIYQQTWQFSEFFFLRRKLFIFVLFRYYYCYPKYREGGALLILLKRSQRTGLEFLIWVFSNASGLNITFWDQTSLSSASHSCLIFRTLWFRPWPRDQLSRLKILCFSQSLWNYTTTTSSPPCLSN